jgi:hypothetical protein
MTSTDFRPAGDKPPPYGYTPTGATMEISCEGPSP